VLDAIPWNGAIQHARGVLTSFNSDSDELARRLNLEAAKAVRYGGLSPETALRFVTIHPARQLEIDARVGSLEPGKDADFVIWSGPPLSTFSVAEQTWIEGRRYFDRAEDRRARERLEKERRARLATLEDPKQEEPKGDSEPAKSPDPGSEGALRAEVRP
jgi:adenine deaminase